MLIGLVGKARSGKDTAADALVKAFGAERYAFADPLKDMLEAAFGDKFREGDRESPIPWLGKSPRHLMQTLGTEWGRELVHPDLWVLLAESRRKVAEAKGVGMVVSDVRFLNEADWIMSSGGLLIEILRPGAEQVAEHVSEDALGGLVLPTQIINDGTVQDLQDTVVQYVEAWENRYAHVV